MQGVKLNAELRSTKGKSAAKKLRQEGKVPANFYLHGEENVSLTLNKAEMEKLLSARHAVIDLAIAKKSVRRCIIREVQYDPLSSELIHVDFMGIKASERMVSIVPVITVGTSLAVRDAGGRVSLNVHELQVECLPKDLPEVIELDVSNLHPGDNILAGDIKIPNVSILLDGDVAIVTAKGARAIGIKPEEKEEVEEEVPTEAVAEAE